MHLTYHVQTAFLGVPIIYLGYFFQNHKNDFSRLMHPVALLISCGVLVAISLMNIGQIELSANMIISPLLFYPVTLVGICFCLSLGNLLNRRRISSRLFSYAGKKSFHIMASHFLVLKLTDLLISLFRNTDPSVLAKFPYSHEGAGLLYTLMGVSIPLIICFTYDKLHAAYKQSHTLSSNT